MNMASHYVPTAVDKKPSPTSPVTVAFCYSKFAAGFTSSWLVYFMALKLISPSLCFQKPQKFGIH